MKLTKMFMGLATLLMIAGSVAQGQEKKIVIGILPTYDTSGESYGASVSQMMTGMLYQQFAGTTRFQPVFLNPGGLYDPTSTSWVAEYVQTLGTPIDVVLATTFIQPDTAKHNDIVLHLRSVALDSKTGDALETTVASTPLKDYKAMLDTGFAYIPTGYFDTGIYQPSRNFNKQPLGKASFELSKQSAASAVLNTNKLTASGVPPEKGGPKACKMRIKINYVEKHAISKSYSCIINEKEESLGIKEGLLEVEEPASPVLIQIKVNDAPYKLPKQELYLFDPILDCSRTSNQLDINIGAAGEARYTWK